MNEHLNKDGELVPEEKIQQHLKMYLWNCPIATNQTVSLRAMAESEIEAKKLILQEIGIKEFKAVIIEFFSKPWNTPAVYDSPRAGIYTESIPVIL